MSPASSPPVSPATPAPLHGTTVISVRKGKSVVVVADGQVTFGDTVLKANARKTRSLSNGKVIAGFAGATADATEFASLPDQPPDLVALLESEGLAG